MRLRTAATIAAALLLSAAPALADTGQCYDAYGRPVGRPFDTFHPNRAFIDRVIARGGNCTVAEAQPRYAPPTYAPPTYAPAPSYTYRNYDRSNDPGGTHSDWCGTNPPSGYCMVPENTR